MSETTYQPKRKVFLATLKSDKQIAELPYKDIFYAFDIAKSAEEAEFIIVDLEDPLPPVNWAAHPQKFNDSNLVAQHCYPPIVLLENGDVKKVFKDQVLPGLLGPGEMKTCKTVDEILGWLRSLERAVPFFNWGPPEAKELIAQRRQDVAKTTVAGERARPELKDTK